MIRRIGNITLGVVAAMVMACSMGCSRDGDQVVDVTTTTAISFDVAVADSQTISRAALTNSVSDLTEFNIYAVENSTDAFLYPKLDGVEVSKSGLNWNYDGNATWPEAGTVNFFAVAPTAMKFDDAQTAETRSLNYTVPTACDDQVDLMVDASAYTETGCGGVVPIEFEHALSAIRFSIAGDVSSSVTAIKISKVYGTATLTATAADGTFVWSDYADKGAADYAPILGTQKTPNADGSACIITTDEGYLMMLPQALPYDSQIEVEVTTTLSDDVSWSRDVKYIPLTGDTWKSGYIYTYNLTVDAGEIDCELSVEPWNTSTVYFEDSDLFDVPMTQVINLDDYPTVGELETTITERIETYETTDFVVYGSYYNGVFGDGSSNTTGPFEDTRITTLDFSRVDMGEVTTLPSYAFATSGSTRAITSIILPSSITAIGNYAFMVSSKLSSVTSVGVTEIGISAFYGSGITTIDMPNIVTVRSSAFQNCKSIDSLYLPNVSLIESLAFNGWTEDADLYLTSPDVITISSASSTTADYTGINLYLNKCKDLLTYPDYVGGDGYNGTDVDSDGNPGWNGRFWKSVNFYSEEIDYSIIDLDDYQTVDLLTATINNRVAAGFTEFTVTGTYLEGMFGSGGTAEDLDPDYTDDNRDDDTDEENAAEDALVADFISKYVPSPFANIEITSLDLSAVDMNGETVLPGLAFISGVSAESRELQSVILPDGITEIGDCAFGTCVYLQELGGLNGVKEVGFMAFGHTAITSIYLPNATFIDEYAFSSCVDLKTVDLPLAETLGEGAFTHCGNLEYLYLPSATFLGFDIFYDLHNQKSDKTKMIEIWLTSESVIQVEAGDEDSDPCYEYFDLHISSVKAADGYAGADKYDATQTDSEGSNEGLIWGWGPDHGYAPYTWNSITLVDTSEE